MGWGVSPTPRPPPTPGKIPYPFYRRLGGPQGRSGWAENLVPTGIRSQTVQPVVSRYTIWATRPIRPFYTSLNIYINIDILKNSSSAGIVTRLRCGRQWNCVSIADRINISFPFFLHSDQTKTSWSSYRTGTGVKAAGKISCPLTFISDRF